MKKLAIVGGAPSSEMLAPFGDPEYEIWVLGNRAGDYSRYDLIFEIHDGIEAEHGPDYAKWLVSKNIPLVVGRKFPLKASHIEVFPFKESIELFGSLYLTSSPAYMLCYAILHGYEHIELYGVDMAIDDHEYFWQLRCVEAWVGFARGKGITVIPHKTSPVCKSSYTEGVDSAGKPDFALPPFTEDDFLGLARRHADKISQLQQQIRGLTDRIHGHEGARQVYTNLARTARAIEAGIEIETLTATVQE